MGKLTREQINTINGKCKNGWELDIQYFLFHNEKKLYKRINLDDENYLQFDLLYNYKKQISLHISKYHHKQGDFFACSNGLGKSKVLEETPASRKIINKLIELTEKLTDDELIKINSETDVIRSPIFVPSEVF